MGNLIRDHLGKIYPLNQLPSEATDELLPQMRIGSYSRGDRVFQFGESPDSYFYVLEGSLSLTDHGQKYLETVGPVSKHESIPLPYMVPSVHEAKAVTDTKLLLVDRRQLLDVLKRYKPKVGRVERAKDGLAVSSPPPLRGERVLLVEDNPTDAKIIQLLLRSLGYDSDWVQTGDEALNALERQKYFAILQDVQLPGVDGYEITRRIRARWNPTQCPRIIAVTARTLKGDREACLAAGMDDYIPKPVSVHLLAAKLSSENWALVDSMVIQHFSQHIGKAGMSQLIQTYLDTLPSMVNDLRTAIVRTDSASLRTAAHSLKAASEILGVKLVHGYAVKLEQLTMSESLDGAKALLTQIESVQQETELELKRLAASYGA